MNPKQTTQYINNNLNDLSKIRYKLFSTNKIAYIDVLKNKTVPIIYISYYKDFFKFWMDNTEMCTIIGEEIIKEYNYSPEHKFQLQLALTQNEIFAIELHLELKSFFPMNF